MKSRRSVPIFVLELALCVLLCGCFSDQKSSESSKRPVQRLKVHKTSTILRNQNSSIQITLPKGWREDKELHEDADLQASNRADEKYVIILSDSKEDFEKMSLSEHSEITRGSIIKILTAPQVTGPVELTINDLPAIQYEIRGSTDNINVVYLHTTVETSQKFYQILAWTVKSRFEKNKSELQEVTNSFQESAAGSTAKGGTS